MHFGARVRISRCWRARAPETMYLYIKAKRTKETKPDPGSG